MKYCKVLLSVVAVIVLIFSVTSMVQAVTAQIEYIGNNTNGIVTVYRDGSYAGNYYAAEFNIKVDGVSQAAYNWDLDNTIYAGQLFNVELIELNEVSPWCEATYILNNNQAVDDLTGSAIQVALWKLLYGTENLYVIQNVVEDAAELLLAEANGKCGIPSTEWIFHHVVPTSGNIMELLTLSPAPTPPVPSYTSNGFEPPVDDPSVPFTVKKNKCVPLKTEIIGEDELPITDADIQSSPVLVLESFDGASQPDYFVEIEGVSSGEATVGNQFEFIGGRWCLNLKVKDYYTAPGLYVFKIISGNLEEYIIEPAPTIQIVVEK
jgi:hypothetical protein